MVDPGANTLFAQVSAVGSAWASAKATTAPDCGRATTTATDRSWAPPGRLAGLTASDHRSAFFGNVNIAGQYLLEIVGPADLSRYPRNSFPVYIAVVNMRETKRKSRTATKQFGHRAPDSAKTENCDFANRWKRLQTRTSLRSLPRFIDKCVTQT